jgi:carbonic anhydrase
LKHDTALIRSHDGVPRHVDIFGYFYDIDTGVLTEVVRDIHRDDRSQAKVANEALVMQTA